MTPSTLALTPHGRLTVVSVPDAPPLPFELAKQLVKDSALGSGQVLLGLGAEHVGAALPPVVAWWRDLAVRNLTALCTLPVVAEHLPGRVPAPDAGELQALAWSAPPMDGAEYLSVEVLERLWQELDATLHAALHASGQPLGAYLKARHPAWNDQLDLEHSPNWGGKPEIFAAILEQPVIERWTRRGGRPPDTQPSHASTARTLGMCSSPMRTKAHVIDVVLVQPK